MARILTTLLILLLIPALLVLVIFGLPSSRSDDVPARKPVAGVEQPAGLDGVLGPESARPR